MYQGKHLPASKSNRKRRMRFSKSFTILMALLVLLVSVGGTLAYLTTKTDGLVNTFTPSEVKNEVTEEFDGQHKSNVNVKNTGDIDAYIRVNLVTYRVNDAGNRIGGTATIPTFTPGSGWVEYNGFYYYTKPVKPGEKPATNLIDRIELITYTDADGGKQVIEVMAEAIQAVPAEAVGEAWGVSISEGSVSAYTAG